MSSLLRQADRTPRSWDVPSVALPPKSAPTPRDRIAASEGKESKQRVTSSCHVVSAKQRAQMQAYAVAREDRAMVTRALYETNATPDDSNTKGMLLSYVMNDWKSSYASEVSSYKSFLVFLELKLAQIVRASSVFGVPNRTRTFAMCEVMDMFCESMPARYSPILSTLRHELFSAIFESFSGDLSSDLKTYFDVMRELLVKQTELGKLPALMLARERKARQKQVLKQVEEKCTRLIKICFDRWVLLHLHSRSIKQRTSNLLRRQRNEQWLSKYFHAWTVFARTAKAREGIAEKERMLEELTLSQKNTEKVAADIVNVEHHNGLLVLQLSQLCAKHAETSELHETLSGKMAELRAVAEAQEAELASVLAQVQDTTEKLEQAMAVLTLSKKKTTKKKNQSTKTSSADRSRRTSVEPAKPASRRGSRAIALDVPPEETRLEGRRGSRTLGITEQTRLEGRRGSRTLGITEETRLEGRRGSRTLGITEPQPRRGSRGMTLDVPGTLASTSATVSPDMSRATTASDETPK